MEDEDEDEPVFNPPRPLLSEWGTRYVRDPSELFNTSDASEEEDFGPIEEPGSPEGEDEVRAPEFTDDTVSVASPRRGVALFSIGHGLMIPGRRIYVSR